MIKSKIVKINKIENFDNSYIEKELLKRFKDFVRWAVVDISEKDIVISVSFII